MTPAAPCPSHEGRRGGPQTADGSALPVGGPQRAESSVGTAGGSPRVP